MANSYAQKLLNQKARDLQQAQLEGMQFMGSLTVVALNNLFGFGKDRLQAVEDEINRLIVDEFGDDPEVAAYGLKKRIEQIRGKGYLEDGEDLDACNE